MQSLNQFKIFANNGKQEDVSGKAYVFGIDQVSI